MDFNIKYLLYIIVFIFNAIPFIITVYNFGFDILTLVLSIISIIIGFLIVHFFTMRCDKK